MATANVGSLMSASTSCSSTFDASTSSRRVENSASSAGRHGGDRQLRHPDRKRPHRVRGDRRNAGAAQRTNRVQPAVRVQPEDDLHRSAPHHLDGRTAIARVGESLHVSTCCRRNLLACEVGLGQGLAEDSRVDQHHVDAPCPDAVA